MPDLLDAFQGPPAPIQDPPPQELRRGFGVPGFGEINPGITPGQWQTIRGPFQLPATDPNQAMAEYEARVSAPRTSPFGGVLPADIPAALQQELLSPFQIGLQQGMKAVAPNKMPQGVKSGEDYWTWNGTQFNKAITGTPKMDEATKSRKRILESEIINKTKSLTTGLTPLLPKIKLETEAEIANKKAELNALLGESTSPQRWQIDPSNIPPGAPVTSMTPPMRGGFVPAGTQTPPMRPNFPAVAPVLPAKPPPRVVRIRKTGG